MSEAPFDPRPFIERARWTLSKTTEEWPDWRHWYIVESHYADHPDVRAFAELIEREGYVARFEGIMYRYLRVDDFLSGPRARCGRPVRTSTAARSPTLRDAPSTSKAGCPCDAPEVLTKLLTTPKRVVIPANENPLSPGGFSVELAGLEPATSWVRSRRSPS
jgi:hypothetical protein